MFRSNLIDKNGNKPGDLFDTIDEAAKDAAVYMGAFSFENGWEYAASIYSKKTIKYLGVIELNLIFCVIRFPIFTLSTVYTYDNIVTDKKAMSVSVPDVPPSKDLIAAVHTHPMGSGRGITRFSDYYDKNGERKGDKAVANALGMVLYVYGPNGELRRYNPTTQEDILIYSDLPLSPKTPWLS